MNEKNDDCVLFVQDQTIIFRITILCMIVIRPVEQGVPEHGVNSNEFTDHCSFDFC